MIAHSETLIVVNNNNNKEKKQHKLTMKESTHQ